MKKEEFLTKLKKNLSVLEEGEVWDIVEEYEQHIDMKMKEGLSEEAAIKDFGDLKELTAGILEAYHVKSDYNTEKKNIDFDKVKEESKKATEKATSALGKGANALGKGAGTAGKWGIRQIKRLWNFIKKPFILFRKRLQNSKKESEKKGFWGALWMMVLKFCRLIWRFAVWCVELAWNLFWLFTGIFMSFSTLGCIFLFGILIVLLAMGYPVIGVTMITVGAGMVSGAVMIFCFVLIKKRNIKKDTEDITKDFDGGDFGHEENEWEYPEDNLPQAKKITVNSYQEVINHA